MSKLCTKVVEYRIFKIFNTVLELVRADPEGRGRPGALFPVPAVFALASVALFALLVLLHHALVGRFHHRLAGLVAPVQHELQVAEHLVAQPPAHLAAW